MSMHRAVLVAKEIDGVPIMKDYVPIGQEFMVDLSTRRRRAMYNTEVQRLMELDMAMAKNITTGNNGLLPLCIFEIDEGEAT